MPIHTHLHIIPKLPSISAIFISPLPMIPKISDLIRSLIYVLLATNILAVV